MTLWRSTWPLDEAEWRRVKAATRHRRFLERFTQAQSEYKAWLAAREAVRRDEATDSYERPFTLASDGRKWQR